MRAIRLPLLMSRGRAMEFMLSAKPLSAHEAHQSGLINRVVPPGEALEAALCLARDIAGNSPGAVAAIKRGVLLGEREGYQAALAYEAQIAKGLMHGPDAREGIQSFLEKRKPVFEDR